ncbi:MAG TPA: antitoxin VbhA family protein [Candidatus Angelobacter sp.]
MSKNGQIDSKERKLRAEAVEYGFASVRIEGLEPGPEAEAIARRFVEGELSRDEYSDAMRKLALSIAQNGH